mmetsp:Transcript_23126/g.56222  ORF Transcript_23126/g.56222 Transcript_23126/m.56222 type:complete len:426 (+) Transcript_23126:60-1337(+)
MGDAPKEHPVSEEEIEALRAEISDDSKFHSQVWNKLVVCDEFGNTARRFVVFAKQLPRGEQTKRKKRKKKGAAVSAATDDAIFYMREALRLRDLVDVDSVWDASRISPEQGKAILKVNPFAFGGHDKQGSPIMWADAGKINGSEVASVWDMCEVKDSSGKVMDDIHNVMVNWYLRQMEYVTQVAMVDLKRKSAGPHWDRIVLVLDASGVGMSSWSTKVKRWMVACQDIGNVAYANMLKSVFVVNVPYFVKGIWSMIKPFLDPFVAAKVRLYGKSETTKELQAHIDRANLIDFLGGDLRQQDVVADFSGDLVAEKRIEKFALQAAREAEQAAEPVMAAGDAAESIVVPEISADDEAKPDSGDARTSPTDSTEVVLESPVAGVGDTEGDEGSGSDEESEDDLEFLTVPELAVDRDADRGGFWCSCAC